MRRDLCKVIRARQTARARHVLHDNLRLARQIFAQMARYKPAQNIIRSSGLERDDERHRFRRRRVVHGDPVELEVRPVGGEAVQKLIQEVYASPPAVVKRAAAIEQ